MKERIKQNLLYLFIGVPLLFSVISTSHIVDLFMLGDSKFLAYAMAIGIEVGAVAAFLGLSVMDKLNKWIVWSMFFLLFALQIVGNVYSAYAWVTSKVLADPKWISYFQDMLNFVTVIEDQRDVKMILALICGIPSPLFSLFLLKSTMDYLAPDKEVEPLVKVEPIQIPAEKIAEIDEPTPSTEIDITGEIEETEEQRRKRLHPSLL